MDRLSELKKGEYVERISGTSGRDRLSMMYRFYNGHLSPECRLVSEGMLLGATFGYITGALNYYHQGKTNFKRTNLHTKFIDIRQAKRSMYDYALVNSAKGGFRLAWRAGLFSGCYFCTLVTVAVYRNKFGFVEHICGGSVAGLMYRCHMGLRGCFAGAVLGAGMGCFSGGLCLLLLKSSGVTLPELRAEWYNEYEKIVYTPKLSLWDKIGAAYNLVKSSVKED